MIQLGTNGGRGGQAAQRKPNGHNKDLSSNPHAAAPTAATCSGTLPEQLRRLREAGVPQQLLDEVACATAADTAMVGSSALGLVDGGRPRQAWSADDQIASQVRFWDACSIAFWKGCRGAACMSGPCLAASDMCVACCRPMYGCLLYDRDDAQYMHQEGPCEAHPVELKVALLQALAHRFCGTGA